MIGKVMRGRDVGGLLRYLYGPGRANEHADPHLVAAWDPDTATLEPRRLAAGRHDVRRLAGLLGQPVAAAVRRPRRPVWHCAVRTAPGDRPLSDAEWAAVARDVVARTGLAADGDDGGCRWVAVRHADDHIHIVVTLARQDGRPAGVNNDFYRVGEACRAAEARYGLRGTAPRNRTAGARPTRAESEKASRAGRREPSRTVLQRRVRAAAAAAGTPSEFLAKLGEHGLLVRERRSQLDPAQITGYAVALPGDRSAAGDPIWYGGGKLAPDLSWPSLARRWPALDGRTATTPPRLSGRARRDAWHGAAAASSAAASATRRPSAAASDIAAATADMLAATAATLDGRHGGPLTDASDTFARAGPEPFGRAPPRTVAGQGLRAAARTLALLGRAGPDEATDALALLAALTELTTAVARLRALQGRAEQAAAAQAAADRLRAARRGLGDLHRQIHSPDVRRSVHRSGVPQRHPPHPDRKVQP